MFFYNHFYNKCVNNVPRKQTSPGPSKKSFYPNCKCTKRAIFSNELGEVIFVYCWLKYVYERIFYCVYTDDEEEGSKGK